MQPEDRGGKTGDGQITIRVATVAANHISSPVDRRPIMPLRVGEWDVDPVGGNLARNGQVVRIEARTMRLLVHLAQRAGEVVSIDELLNEVWAGVIVTSDSVYQAITSLRRVLGDDPKRPTYIATVPRRGYRLVAKVGESPRDAPGPAAPVPAANGDPATIAASPSRARTLRGPRLVVASGVGLLLAVVAAFALRGQFTSNEHPHSAAPAVAVRKSIAVVPFIDLTDGMSHEYFADGVTEEVIDKLSKVPDLRVAAPTSSFYLKGRQIAIADIARTLGVAYVLDGSVRKSGATLRVAARLSRGDNGYVVWSETYDRPVGDILMIQDDIASAVTKALRTSIDSG
jgi:TolB-like protein/DNA-binding winged helix-turn-helix (wHTH) protein